MSTSYTTVKKPKISFIALKRKLMEDDALKKYGIRYARRTKREEGNFAIVDSAGNYLWVYKLSNGYISFDRYGANDVSFILDSLERILNMEILSEHQLCIDEIS